MDKPASSGRKAGPYGATVTGLDQFDNRSLMGRVIETLMQFSDKRIFFEPLEGNNGDRLIEMGSRHVLSNSGLSMVTDPKDADVIIINGNAGIAVELYGKDLPLLRLLTQGCRDKLLVILPSSYYFEGSGFSSCFDERSAPAYIFARERYSYDLIQKQTYPSDVTIGLDHDMAFALADSEFLRALKSRTSEKHVLIVERFDVESATDVNRQLPIPDKFKRLIPGPIKRSLKKVLHTHRAAHTGFTQSTLQHLYRNYPQFIGLPVLAQDISSIVGFTFEQFTQAIADAAVVVTTRLHVAILAAMLNKMTFIKTSAGPYQKVRGIYEYSMSHLGHVQLW